MQLLVHHDLLQTLTEVSVAFVGFSMLANVLRRSTGGEFIRFLGYRDVAATGVIGMLGSLTPLLLHSFGWPGEAVWRWSTAIFGAVYIAAAASSFRRQRDALLDDVQTIRKRLGANPLFHTIQSSLFVVVVVLALINVFAPGPASAARHVLAVAISLVAAGWIFLDATFGGNPEDSTHRQRDKASE